MKSVTRISISVASLLLCGLVVLFGWTLWTTQAHYSVLFLALCLIICALAVIDKAPDRGAKAKVSKFGAPVLICLTIVASLYFYVEYEELMYRSGANTRTDLLFSVLILIPVLALIWKEGGAILTLLILLFLGYARFGYIFPGLLFHKGLAYDRILEMFVLNYEGIYGFVIQVVATWVTIFVVYAGLLQGFGAFDVILKLCVRFSRKRRWALPQMPVVTSMIFGMFSGAAAANVAGTGSFTIPLLKKFGFPPWFAGAIESVASTGGQIMPPIMGATAFLMAALLGISYAKIMLVGFIPALIFFCTVGFSVHLLGRRYLIAPVEGEEIGQEAPVTRKDLFKLMPMIVSLAVLLLSATYFLIPLMRSALYGIGTLFVLELVYLLIASRSAMLREFFAGILRGANQAALPAASIGVVGAAMGMIVKSMTVTALAPKLSFLMLDLAGGSLYLLVFLILLVSLLFGCIVATLAVYILVVFLAASALQEFGVPPFVTHFMIFYFSAAAMITPPVAPAALVAAGIAKTSFMKTGWESMKLGISFLTLPLAFLNYPDLIIMGSGTIPAILLVTVAHLLMSYGFYSSGSTIWTLFYRTMIALAGGVILFCPIRTLNGVVAVVAGATVAIQLCRSRATQRPRHRQIDCRA